MRRTAQIWDCIEVFGKKYNNHHMYCTIELQSHIDEVIFESAINRSLEVFPILKSSYVTGAYRAYWLEDSSNKSRITLELDVKENDDRDITGFLRNEIRETSGPQIKAKIIRNRMNDRILISINHMICDASDFKRYLYILGGIYTELLKDKNYVPEFICDGNRSGVRVYLKFLAGLKSRADMLRALFRLQNHRSYPLTMNFKDNSSLYPFIAARLIDRERFQSLKQYCEVNKVTINDIFLSAFIRTIQRYIPNPEGEIDVPCMVDLRRFLKEDKFDALKNLTSTLIISIGKDIGKNRDETVRKVHQRVTELIDGFPALDGYLYLILLFKLLPISVIKTFIDRHFKSFPIAYSNLGIIDPEKLRFGDLVVEDCMMTGSIKQKPCFWLALSSYGKKVTLTINLNGNREDQQFAEKFLEDMEQELPA